MSIADTDTTEASTIAITTAPITTDLYNDFGPPQSNEDSKQRFWNLEGTGVTERTKQGGTCSFDAFYESKGNKKDA